MTELNVSTRVVADESSPVTVITMEGSLDAETAWSLGKSFTELLEKENYNWVVDLTRLRYISSAGISSLMSLTRRVKEKKRDVIFIKPGPSVYRVLELVGFPVIFSIVSSEEEAIAEFKKRSANP